MTNKAAVAQMDDILEYLRQTRGIDFTAYRRPSLMRRTLKRMQVVKVATFEEYFDYLQAHHEEAASLVSTILINFTGFFRDPEVWQYLAVSVVPRMLGEHGSANPLLVRSAGCAAGQEAYSVAMILAEHLGIEGFRSRVRIDATDIDVEALADARHGIYTDRDLAGVPPHLRGRYFESSGVRYVFHPDLRQAVIFGTHNLVEDAPISRVDLLLCRNTLMYFNGEAQSRVLAQFSRSLNEGGALVVGRTELLLNDRATFMPVDLNRRVFRPVPMPNQISSADAPG